MCSLKQNNFEYFRLVFSRRTHLFHGVRGSSIYRSSLICSQSLVIFPSSHSIFKLGRKRKATRQSAPPDDPVEVVELDEGLFDAKTKAKLKFADNALRLIGLGIENKKETYHTLNETQKNALKSVQV